MHRIVDLGAALPALVLTVALLVLNGFFVAAEFAIVRVRGTQLDELAASSARARLAKHITDHIDAYLSACQVGITGASLALGIVGEPAVARLIEPLFGWLTAFSEPAFHAVSFAIAFAIITYLHLVAAEQAPKYLAIQRAVPTSLLVAYPLYWFSRAAAPFIWIVNQSANAILGWFGIKPGDELQAASEEELKMLVAVSTRQGILQESERVIVGNALEFADTLVRQVMVPRTEIVAVPDDTPIDGVIAVARENPFSRYPVYHEDLDHVVGVVHLRDLVGREVAGIREIMRPVAFVPETMRLDQALAEFRRRKSQLAIVLDEFGGTAGLITLEDVIEQLVGEVQDEFDRETPAFVEEGPGVFKIDGLASVDELRERLKIDLPDAHFDTVGGLVFGRLGRVAKVGDRVEIDGFRFEVTVVDGRRVAQVRATRRHAA